MSHSTNDLHYQNNSRSNNTWYYMNSSLKEPQIQHLRHQIKTLNQHQPKSQKHSSWSTSSHYHPENQTQTPTTRDSNLHLYPRHPGIHQRLMAPAAQTLWNETSPSDSHQTSLSVHDHNIHQLFPGQLHTTHTQNYSPNRGSKYSPHHHLPGVYPQQ